MVTSVLFWAVLKRASLGFSNGTFEPEHHCMVWKLLGVEGVQCGSEEMKENSVTCSSSRRRGEVLGVPSVRVAQAT